MISKCGLRSPPFVGRGGAGGGRGGRGLGDAGMHPNQTNHLGHALENRGNSSAMKVEGGASTRPVRAPADGWGRNARDSVASRGIPILQPNGRARKQVRGLPMPSLAFADQNARFFKAGGNFEVMSKQE